MPKNYSFSRDEMLAELKNRGVDTSEFEQPAATTPGDQPYAAMTPGAESRTRIALGLGPAVEAQAHMAQSEQQAGGNPYDRHWIASTLGSMDEGGLAKQLGFSLDPLARKLGGPEYQDYTQAAKTWEAAVLPVLSGAAVTPSEAQRQLQANLPQLGDTPEVLSRKATNRAMMDNAAADLVGRPRPHSNIGTWNVQTGAPHEAQGSPPQLGASPPPSPMAGPPADGLRAGPGPQGQPQVQAPQTQPRAPLQADQGLGLQAGALKPLDNAAIWLEGLAKKFGVPVEQIDAALGMPSADQARAAHQQAILAAARQGRRPGQIGETIGNIGATIPLALATRNPTLLAGLQGAALTDDPHSASGTAMSGLGGAVLGKVGGALAEGAANLAAPVIDPAVRLLQQAGVKLTPGQILGGAAKRAEDAATSRPFVGEAIRQDRAAGSEQLNRAAVNKALLPLGLQLPDSVATGHDAVAWMQRESGKALDKATGAITGLMPDRAIHAGIQRAWQTAQTLPQQEAEVFNKLLQKTLRFDPQTGVMPKNAVVGAMRDLRDQAAKFGQSGDEYQRQLGEALSHVSDGFQAAVARQNPLAAAALKKANLAYRGNRIVSDAAVQAKGGVATPGQLKQAVIRADPTKNKRASAAGGAYMQDLADAAARVLPSGLGELGTAPRLEAGQILPAIRGAAGNVVYQTRKALSPLATAQRPQVVQDIAAAIRSNPGVVRLLADPTIKGLFGGLLQTGQ